MAAKHVFDWLMEIGPTKTTGMGREPIGWSAIRDWKDLTFTRPSAWEARLLHRLSIEYLAESQLAEDRMRPAPWSGEPGKIDHEANERQLRNVLG